MSTSSEGNVISEKEVDIFPASFAQQRLWLLVWLELQSTTYLITSVVRVNLPLNLELLAYHRGRYLVRGPYMLVEKGL